MLGLKGLILKWSRWWPHTNTDTHTHTHTHTHTRLEHMPTYAHQALTHTHVSGHAVLKITCATATHNYVNVSVHELPHVRKFHTYIDLLCHTYTYQCRDR